MNVYTRYMSSYFGGSSDCFIDVGVKVEKCKIPLCGSNTISQFGESMFVGSVVLSCSFGSLCVGADLPVENEFIPLLILNTAVPTFLE